MGGGGSSSSGSSGSSHAHLANAQRARLPFLSHHLLASRSLSFSLSVAVYVTFLHTTHPAVFCRTHWSIIQKAVKAGLGD